MFVTFIAQVGAISVPLLLYALRLERRITQIETKLDIFIGHCPMFESKEDKGR